MMDELALLLMGTNSSRPDPSPEYIRLMRDFENYMGEIRDNLMDQVIERGFDSLDMLETVPDGYMDFPTLVERYGSYPHQFDMYLTNQGNRGFTPPEFEEAFVLRRWKNSAGNITQRRCNVRVIRPEVMDDFLRRIVEETGSIVAQRYLVKAGVLDKIDRKRYDRTERAKEQRRAQNRRKREQRRKGKNE
jgi:hypothetical protein